MNIASGESCQPSNGSSQPSLELAQETVPTVDWLHEADLWTSFLWEMLERLIIGTWAMGKMIWDWGGLSRDFGLDADKKPAVNHPRL